jgi:hypothetical protein
MLVFEAGPLKAATNSSAFRVTVNKIDGFPDLVAPEVLSILALLVQRYKYWFYNKIDGFPDLVDPRYRLSLLLSLKYLNV